MKTKRTPWTGKVTPIVVHRDLSPQYLLICVAARAAVSNEQVVLSYAYDEDVFVISATIVLPLMYGRGRNRNHVKIHPRGATVTELFADLDRDLVQNGIEPRDIPELSDEPDEERR